LRVLAIGYRLAPEAPWPAQHDDAVASALWALKHADELGLDPRNIALGGDSAGALMALWAAPHLLDVGLAPKGILLIYPLLTLEDAEWAGPPLESLRVVGRIAVAYIRSQLGAAALIESAVSDAALKQLPPVLLVSAGVDPVRPDAKPFSTRLEAAGIPVRNLVFPRLVHGSFNLTHLSPAARRAVKATGEAAAKLLAC
jgi:acetyl esterase